MKNEIFNNIKRFFENHPKIKLCIVFGSFADGKENMKSDIDIVIGSEENISYEYMADLQTALSGKLKIEVDLIDISTANGIILKQILTKGKRIINDNTDILAYHIRRMWYFEADMMGNVMMILEKKVKRFVNG